MDERIKETGKIYSTEAYELFKKMVGNRNVAKLSKLKEAIRKDGQITPIVVNKDFEIVDGQHRLEV